ncbi:sensor histidine kinase [[Clostridium] polysaccharolyticum]|uniref:histidine kinase n=1 Tax=[Clostridium] polysaccharolyticum TaxID=29364 RepID=A0A1I0EGM7_9FIRM|nr:HAMP domain-containing sensor histidine kinase [[Clostridium] polysaccharolyticum]SET44486.1 Signal transduction histidine kinase [[Clostridium] polysaccharolyticum]
MKLTTKMSLWVAIVLCVSLSFSGCLFITKAFSYSMKREQKRAVNQYQFVKFVLQSNMISESAGRKFDKQFISGILNSGIDRSRNYAAVFNEVKEEMNSTFPSDYHYGIADDLESGLLHMDVKQYQEKYYLELSGVLKENKETMYLLCATDVSSVVSDRKQLEKVFYYSYLLVFSIGSVLVFTFSSIMMWPIKQLSKSAQVIAHGNYSERVKVRTKDEIGELSCNFNKMADAIETSIEDLKLAVLKQENFVANFAHELKTSLTSVIGYSDRIYHKNLSREETKEAAEYIMNEGLRLESLSRKLMDLIVLGKHDFMLEYLNANDLFQNIKETTAPLFYKKESRLILDIEPAYLKVEFDLLKTLMLNLLDNAMKANATQIQITGRKEDNKYIVCVSDNGIGIPKEDQKRIVEAFYVVDKSRSREQNGVGLGLALAQKIAEIHGTSFTIESELGKGTSICFALAMEEA